MAKTQEVAVVLWFYSVALGMAKTSWSLGHSEFNRVNDSSRFVGQFVSSSRRKRSGIEETVE